MTSGLQTEQAAFIRAICTDPADDTRRLAYADWLDEHDQPERAEFIRVGVELENWKDEENCPQCGTHWRFGASNLNGNGSDYWCESDHKWVSGDHKLLVNRSAELLAAHEREWRSEVLGKMKSLGHWNVNEYLDRGGPDGGSIWDVKATWTRGFVSGIECTLETFEQAAKAGLFRMQPVTSVKVSDVNIHKTDYPDNRRYTWSEVPPRLLPDFGAGRVKWWHPTEVACRQYLSEQFVTYGLAIAGLPTLNQQVTA